MKICVDICEQYEYLHTILKKPFLSTSVSGSANIPLTSTGSLKPVSTEATNIYIFWQVICMKIYVHRWRSEKTGILFLP